jgi:recyclin-1
VHILREVTEILALVVEHLAIPDLIRFARVSRRMQEMVYDDSRWTAKLKRMGCWNDLEARKRAEGSAASHHPRRKSTIDPSLVNGKGRPDIRINSTVPSSDPRTQPTHQSSHLTRSAAADGFDLVTLSSPVVSTPLATEPSSALTAVQDVRSVRGKARQEYGKIYKAVGRYYVDAINSSDPKHTLIQQTYAAPVDQARMASQVLTLSLSDSSPGSSLRDDRIQSIITAMDTAALYEFRQGYEYQDIQGRMRQYAHVMYILNEGKSAVELFLHDSKLIAQKANLGSASDCVDYSLGYGQLSLEKVQAYYERLATAFQQEAAIIQTVFPNAPDVLLKLLERTGDEILSPFLTGLFEDARNRGVSMYLRIISGTFAATRQLVNDCCLSDDSSEEALERATAVLAKLYDPHLESYLAEELAAFTQKAGAEIEQWDRALREQATSTETFLMSNVNRQADKKDFMTSFKKVVMVPVNLLPSFGTSSSKPAAKAPNGDLTPRPSTPGPLGLTRSISPSLPSEAPATELAAKTALMNMKLENIKGLFSIEVALNLVHAAKSSLERVAQFMSLGGDLGKSAKVECATIFNLLLQTVGVRHIKVGFDQAIEHLAAYNPRVSADPTNAHQGQVAPLTTFLELVNVGDLIQQMLDVFYESELVRLRISDRDDFLDPSVKEKKKFEAMLDERVASGLSKGIDVLMEEVEYLCATTQMPTDFNPENNLIVDIGPTRTATQIIDLILGHTRMLTGATEKTLLDVFTGEIGLRLFQAVCQHIKRQRISTAGAMPLISDLSAYANYVAAFRNVDLNNYFNALREVAQIYLIDGKSEKDISEMAAIISDGDRYSGVFTVEEVVEFAERRSDWLLVRGRVERKVQGDGCTLM